MEWNHLEKTLNIFLNLCVSFWIMFVGKKKFVPLPSIGQTIMQQVRLKALIVRLQLGLGIQMHQHFGSRFLID